MTQIPTAFHTIIIDHVGSIEAKGKGESAPKYKFLLVITDYLTKYTIVRPTKSTGASEVIKIILQTVYLFRIPSVIISDRHQSFRSHLMLQVCKSLNIDKHSTASYCPQSNPCEATNKTIVKILKSICQTNPNDWPNLARSTQYAYNNNYHSSIGMSPFQALFGRTNTPPFLRKHIPREQVSQEARTLILNLKKSIDCAQAFSHENLKKAKFLQKDKYDCKNKSDSAHKFEIGDRCWLFVEAINNTDIKKIRLKWHGPYVINSRVSDHTFLLQTDDKILKHPVNQRRLRKYTGENEKPTESIETEEFINLPIDMLPTNVQNTLRREIREEISEESNQLGATGNSRKGNKENIESQNINKEIIPISDNINPNRANLDEISIEKKQTKPSDHSINEQSLKTNNDTNNTENLNENHTLYKENAQNDRSELENVISEPNNNLECEAEKLIASKTTKKGCFYEVRWGNKGPEHDTWEPKVNIEIDPKLLEIFYRDELNKEKRAEIRNRKKILAKSKPITKGT